MILISIILALAIERLGARDAHWQIDHYSKGYLNMSQSLLQNNSLLKSPFAFALWVLLPALGVYFVMDFAGFFLFELALNALLLLVCFGCAKPRALYKGYLNALTRGDSEGATLYALQLGQHRTEDQQGGEWVGQTLAWVNFRHYCAVIFWFVVFGSPGAVMYAVTRSLFDQAQQSEQSVLTSRSSVLADMLYWLNWLPARITSFGYLIIGNFSKGTGCWLKYALDFKTPNRKVVTSTALAAEQIEQQYAGCTYEATCMMRLVKRNILFYLALIALLTLFGGVA
ncbi:beta-lactamase regulator AmpE [Pseudoalteromonas sp. MTN2-4]|uniref:beta-lactamase regulator AmpE n=1 Tax=Pseudoalteromonas sp. MTN2-4 TaxID=3056555 RepID=UPI0036F36C78